MILAVKDYLLSILYAHMTNKGFTGAKKRRQKFLSGRMVCWSHTTTVRTIKWQQKKKKKFPMSGGA